MSKDRFDRQILVFGREGQDKLASTKVGVVGVGGLGSQVCQSLAFLGVNQYVLVDDDHTETTNLNRLIGASPEDALAHTAKVTVAERAIKSISPDAQVTALKVNLRTKQAFEALRQCNLIFGCVDGDGARYVLTEYAAAYSIPLIDCATDIDVETGLFGGRIVFAIPGEFCALCAGQVDADIAKQELETAPEQEFRRVHGYGLGELEPSPAVVSLNGVVANLAATEFVKYVTSIYQPARYLIYKGERGVVTISQDTRRDDCYVCNVIAGSGDSANLERYLRTGLPTDLPN